jgi:hypothetical protein
VRLAGVLRLANAFDSSHDGKVRHLSVERHEQAIVLEADSFNATGANGERIAAARYLLELSCHAAILVRSSTDNTVAHVLRQPA